MFNWFNDIVDMFFGPSPKIYQPKIRELKNSPRQYKEIGTTMEEFYCILANLPNDNSSTNIKDKNETNN